MPLATHHPHIRIVQSRQNSRVKELRAGFAKGNSAKSHGEGVTISIEGVHLLEEALRAGLRIDTIFLRAGSEHLLEQLPLAKNSDCEILQLSPELFSSAVLTESPPGIAALVHAPTFTLDDLALKTGSPPLVVVAASLQDPGNLGTLIRSAEAFGATALITLPGTVSHWNPKALRASSGSAFRLTVAAAEEAATLALLRSNGLQILAATVEDGLIAPSTDLTKPTAFLIGNESAGLSPALIAAADLRVTVPCPGPVESLNAAIAASILLYEASRQRANPHRIHPA